MEERLIRAATIAPVLRMILSEHTPVYLSLLEEEVSFPKRLVLPSSLSEDAMAEAVRRYLAEYGLPHVVTVEQTGSFLVCDLSDARGRLAGKVVLITGAAQGFGKGLAQALSEEGASVLLADLQLDAAISAARFIPDADAVYVDVSDEDSVASMFRQACLLRGGVDVFISNAGIVRAGGLEQMTVEQFELVSKVNYTGYFLGVKYASQIMKLQHRFAPDRFFDIVQINSKSGISGSNKNFAYSGSKFGGIGLTQSFALELAPYRIKVNAVCPGNFLDGPLWSDPEKGLFVQYLKAGKVPGAKTVEDVRRFYEEKVPLGRGCQIADVSRAVLYACEQEYETGQSIPVTGGQEMLN